MAWMADTSTGGEKGTRKQEKRKETEERKEESAAGDKPQTKQLGSVDANLHAAAWGHPFYNGFVKFVKGLRLVARCRLLGSILLRLRLHATGMDHEGCCKQFHCGSCCGGAISCERNWKEPGEIVVKRLHACRTLPAAWTHAQGHCNHQQR